MCSYAFADVSSSSVKARKLGSGVGRRWAAAVLRQQAAGGSGTKPARQSAAAGCSDTDAEKSEAGRFPSDRRPARATCCLRLARLACLAPEAQLPGEHPCARTYGSGAAAAPSTAGLAPADVCPYAGFSSQYRGVYLERSSGAWIAQRWHRERGRQIHLGIYHSQEDAAHVWDLSAICLGLSESQLNFPASEYEAGGQWEEEAREAACVDNDEFATIWSHRARQRTLDGEHSRPANLCRLLLVCNCSASIFACKWSPWLACVCGPASACSSYMQALAEHTVA
jgi:AP2 domain